MRSFKIGVVRFLTVLFAMLMLGTSTFAQVNVTLPTLSGLPGTEKAGAITVGDITDAGISSFQFTINYPKEYISITSATAGSLLAGTEDNFISNPDEANGRVLVAWADDAPLSGSGTLVNLNFEFKSAGVATLDLGSTLKINGGAISATVSGGVITTAVVVVSAGNISAVVGQEIKIPINVTEITAAQDVSSYLFKLSYDNTKIDITGYDLAGTLSEGKEPEINTSVDSQVILAWANSTTITGDGVLIYLTGTALAAGSSDITFTSFKFNGTDELATGTEAGSVVVTAANVAPTLLLNPAGPAYTVNENATLTINLVGADANAGDVLTYSSTTLPTGAALDVTTGVFTWKPSYTQGSATAYSITFKVTDAGGLSAEQAATITVVNVNRAPAIMIGLPTANSIPVVVADVVVPWSQTVIASDPDNDALTFSLEAKPDGAEITADGHFTWAPVPSQANKSYVVTIKVTDGSLSDIKNYTLQVGAIVGVEETEIPNNFVLMQNYPNPFNPSTVIRFGLPNESNVRISVYNILGQHIGTLLDETLSAGFHKVNFNATGLNTGMYIYKIEAGSFVQVKKMLFVK